MKRIGLAVALAAGASWAAAPERPRPAAEIVRQTCVLCHGAGVGGAPRIGNAKEWRARARAGLEALARSAAEGKGAMPPRGGMPDLSDAELRAAIAYMAGI